MGTYLAALVIYEQIFASPPPAVPVPAAAQQAADVLRRIAHETWWRGCHADCCLCLLFSQHLSWPGVDLLAESYFGGIGAIASVSGPFSSS